MVLEWKLGEPLPESKTDYERLKNLTEEEIERNALNDPDALPMSEEQWKAFQRPVPKKGA